MEELFKRVLSYESTKATWRKDYNSLQWREASQANKILTGISLNQSPRCECIEDLYFLLKRGNINQTIKTMSEKQFKLKEGQIIMLHGCTPIGSNSSDEQCIELLKLSPGQIAKFQSYPSNWKEICGIEEGSPKEKAKAAPVKQVEPEVIETAEAVEETTDTEQDESLSEREEELLSMKNSDLKDLVISMEIEMPEKINKVNLVNAILEAEAKG